MRTSGPTPASRSPPTSPTLTRRSLLGLVGGAGLLGAVGTAGCTAIDLGPVEVLPADRIVFGVSAAPGFAPALFWALQAPSVLVYGSGLVVRIEDSGGERDIPSRYVEAHVDPSLVARFAADAERHQARAGDFGVPQVTDLGSTRVWLHGSRAEQGVSVYALAEEFDEYTSWFARRHRRRLRTLIDDAFALVGDAGTPYVRVRVAVLEQRAGTRVRHPPRFAGRVGIPRSSSTVRGRGVADRSLVESSSEARPLPSTPLRWRTPNSSGWSATGRGCSS